MGLGIVLLGPVVFCPPTTAVLDGQSRSLQGCDQLPPDGVGDGGSLPAEGAGLKVGESVFGGGCAAFILIAGLAGEREVEDTVAAVPAAGSNVVAGEGAVVPDEVRDPSASLGDWLPYALAFAWGGSRIGVTERRTGPVSPRFAFRSGNALWVAKLGHNVGNSRGKVIRRCVF